MRPLAHELFDDMAPFAEMLDTAYGGHALLGHDAIAASAH
jgi:hypothetical protein